jgi:threonine dehydrogenase-like Zn-dependent dehydrogenase
MKALAITTGTTDIALIDRPEPVLTKPNQIKVKVLQVGICGTDREEAAGGRADAPAGNTQLVIGHEMFSQVVEVGASVTVAKPGDYGVFMVRRPCGVCPACLGRRSDMCETGNYTERGIKGADGFQQEFVIDDEEFFLPVPAEIKHLGVLTEPTSVGEKAIDEVVRMQAARLPHVDATTWLKGKRTLVVGLGPIGLLAVAILRLRGAEVLGLDIVDADSIRARTLLAFGGKYIDGRTTKTLDLDDTFGQIDLIFEATGVAQLEFDLIDALGINGAYVLTGIPAGDRPVTMQPGSLVQQMVLKNQVLLGSVNAGYEHYQMAIEDLEAAYQQFPDAMANIITDQHPYTNFAAALAHHGSDEIKCVLEWNEGV